MEDQKLEDAWYQANSFNGCNTSYNSWPCTGQASIADAIYLTNLNAQLNMQRAKFTKELCNRFFSSEKNKQFEANAKETIGTLSRLKNALKLPDTTKANDRLNLKTLICMMMDNEKMSMIVNNKMDEESKKFLTEKISEYNDLITKLIIKCIVQNKDNSSFDSIFLN